MAQIGGGLSAPGTMPESEYLNSPPPSPASQQGQSNGTPLGNLVPPLPSTSLPPEVLTGILQAGEKMVEMILSFAQATPDLAQDWAAATESLKFALAKVLQAGAAPTTPNSTGPQFPGGGFDRGGMPSASASG